MSGAAPLTLSELRAIDLFDDLDDTQLADWLAVTHLRVAPPGEIVAEHGEAAPGVFLLLEGRMLTFLISGDHVEPAGRQTAPTWVGAISALTEGTLGVRMQAETTCRLGVIEPGEFRRLALAQPDVHRRVMQQVAPVMSRVTAMEQNRERLASLGTMAAGLAHELNNPAAAAGRAADQMVEAVDVVGATLRRFVESGIEREDAEKLVALQREAIERAAGRDRARRARRRRRRGGAARAARGAGRARAVASGRAARGGRGRRGLAGARRRGAGPATDAAVGWVAASLTARSLAAELQESTRRMSTSSAPSRTTPTWTAASSSRSTCTRGWRRRSIVLGHKLKHTSIDVVRDYDRSLPKLTVRGSELNQVWTNLLANAIDALGELGHHHDHHATRRRLRASSRSATTARASRRRTATAIFDSFFTTKDVGTGRASGSPPRGASSSIATTAR